MRQEEDNKESTAITEEEFSRILVYNNDLRPRMGLEPFPVVEGVIYDRDKKPKKKCIALVKSSVREGYSPVIYNYKSLEEAKEDLDYFNETLIRKAIGREIKLNTETNIKDGYYLPPRAEMED